MEAFTDSNFFNKSNDPQIFHLQKKLWLGACFTLGLFSVCTLGIYESSLVLFKVVVLFSVPLQGDYSLVNNTAPSYSQRTGKCILLRQ